MIVGDTFNSKLYGEVEVVAPGQQPGTYRIKFKNTGTEIEAFSVNIEKGNIKDRFAPSVAGIGYLGNASSLQNPSLYTRWKRMLGACYDSLHMDYPSNGGKGVEVYEKWYNYEVYEKDISKMLQDLGNPPKYRIYRKGDCFSPSSIIIVPIVSK